MNFVCFWLLLTAAAALCSAHGFSLEQLPPAKQTLLLDFAARYGVEQAELFADLQRHMARASNYRRAPGIIEDVFYGTDSPSKSVSLTGTVGPQKWVISAVSWTRGMA
jgi:hypothetical protein